MKVRQHIPNFLSGYESVKAEVDSLEELQALEFIQRWTSDPTFYRFSVHRDYDRESQTHLLMVEVDQGRRRRRWYVVAYLTGDTAMLQHLPEWIGKE